MKERLIQSLRDPKYTALISGVVAFGAGVGVGYILGRKKTETIIEEEEFNKQLEFDFTDDWDKIDVGNLVRDAFEAPEPKQHRPLVIDADEFERSKANHPSNGFGDISMSLDAVEEVEEPSEPEIVHRSVFADDGDDTWDYEEELKNRDPSKPYVLHRDEFYADEMNLSQITLCYYAGDDILADEDDTPVYNYNNVIGDLKFGHGSGDKNVFYVRNEARGAEYEILYHDSLYSVEVLGLEIEHRESSRDLKHSKLVKFRDD